MPFYCDLLMDIILVNWNSGPQLAEAVTSIIQYHRNLVSLVVIVDNASTDDSMARLDAIKDFPFKLKIIRNIENRGFSVACNQGAALASSEYLLFLNPDTRLCENSLSVPLAFMQRTENADVGIVGIQLVDEHNHIARSCARFPSLCIFMVQALGLNRLPQLRHLNMLMSDWAHNDTAMVDHVIGAFYFMRRSLFGSLGGFDERFFVYFEDLDLSLRASQAGWRRVYLSDAQAIHTGGGSSYQAKAHRLFYVLRSRILYGFKHFTPMKAWALLGVTILLEPVSRTMLSFVRGDGQDLHNTWKAYAILHKDMKNILKFSHFPSI